MKATDIHLGQHYAATQRGRPTTGTSTLKVKVLKQIETRGRKHTEFKVKAVGTVSPWLRWEETSWGEGRDMILKSGQFYMPWDDYLKEIEEYRKEAQQRYEEEGKEIQELNRETAEEEERRKREGTIHDPTDRGKRRDPPEIISEKNLEVEVFRRISREQHGIEGDTVRIYWSPTGYYIIWGDPPEIDFSALEPDADPDDSLEAAMGWDYVWFVVHPDTVEVYARMNREELLEKLIPKGAFLDEAVDVNGEPWCPGPTIAALHKHAEQVFTNIWEGGIGAYGQYVYSLDGQYYAYDAFEAENERLPTPFGPYDSLENAIWSCGFHRVTSATSSVHSEELSRDELIALLEPDPTYRGEPVPVNGEAWQPQRRR